MAREILGGQNRKVFFQIPGKDGGGVALLLTWLAGRRILRLGSPHGPDHARFPTGPFILAGPRLPRCSIAIKILEMIGHSQDEPVMRDIEGHGAFRALFAHHDLLIFHARLITELVFAKEGDVLGAHVP